jgi:exodeoxyribonuclease V alpha subunit
MKTADADLGRALAECLAASTPTGAAADHALLRATVRRLWAERALGHTCLPLADWQRRPRDDDGVFPDSGAWAEALAATGVCAPADDSVAPTAPLVLDPVGRLYLRRDFAAERTIAAFVRARLQEPPRMTAAALAGTLAALGLQPSDRGEIDWQLVGVAAAARASFAVLTGGPGTGKTTTIARLLAVLLHERPDASIALCAPTGKAASRLHDALRQRAAVEPAMQRVGERCTPLTLHRLLGYIAPTDSFRADRHSPLRHDVVVVDEASMADPALLAALCDALPAKARLVLVGDRDQLAAVAAGQVLGDLCRVAAPERDIGSALATFVREATGMQLPARSDAAPLANHVVALRANWRFAADTGIGAFAAALARREAAAAFAAASAGHAELQLVHDPLTALAALAPKLIALATAPAATAAQRLGECRILTATRHGPHGALAWNERVHTLLAQHGVRVEEPYYPGRPVLITANDHQNHVYNGDLGVVVREEDRLQIAFPRGDGSVRKLPPSRLPAHETAWALTVHKAQGSEFDEVLLAMPDKPGPMWQAPLVYTGVTRARRRAIVHADAALLAAALAHWPTRSSGLADALAAP